MRVKVTLMLALLGCSLPSFAEGDPCDGSSYMHGSKCVVNKLALAEQELEQVFNDALTRARYEDRYRLKSGGAAIYEDLLRESQRTWREHTDRDCELAGLASGAGGGWAGVHASECVYHNIQKRTADLNGLWAG